MLSRTLIITGLAAVLASGAAFADSATTKAKPSDANKPAQTSQQLTDRCAALEVQFDQAIATHATAPKAAAAKALRAKGESQCKASHQTNGIKSLQQALKDLGVKPGV